MNDYYSEFPCPPREKIAQELVEHLRKEGIVVPYEVALAAAKEMKDYSLTGYRMFGFGECVRALRKKNIGEQ
jgi:hypothetical protein